MFSSRSDKHFQYHKHIIAKSGKLSTVSFITSVHLVNIISYTLAPPLRLLLFLLVPVSFQRFQLASIQSLHV